MLLKRAAPSAIAHPPDKSMRWLRTDLPKPDSHMSRIDPQPPLTYVWLMNGLSIVSSGSLNTVADLNWQVQGTPGISMATARPTCSGATW